MRNRIILTAAIALVLTGASPALAPGGLGLPAMYSYLGAVNFAGSYAAGPRVYSPGGYYSYQLYAYNPAARYGYYHPLPGSRPYHTVTVRTHHSHP